MSSSKSWKWYLAAVLTLALAPRAEALERWALYGGIYDTASEDEQPIELGVEFRWKEIEIPGMPDRLSLRPAAGIAGTEDGNAWVYGGLRLDVALGKWVVTPQFSISLYEDGDGKDLGGVIEFRSGLEVAYRFDKARVGVLFYHLSNADLYDQNPGSNSLVLTVAFGR